MAGVNSIDSYQPVLFMLTYMHGPSEIDSYKTKAVKVAWTDSQADLEDLEKVIITYLQLAKLVSHSCNKPSWCNISAASQVSVTYLQPPRRWCNLHVSAASQVGVTYLQPVKLA